MLPRQLRKVINIWNGMMKYKVLKDFHTVNGVVYKGEIVKLHGTRYLSDTSEYSGDVRIQANMGRLFTLPKKILKEVNNG